MMTSHRRRFGPLGALALGVVLALGPSTLVHESMSLADGVADEAELHFQMGTDAYNQGDYPSALDHFLVSNRLVPNLNVVLNVALTFERMQRFADAHRYYVDALQGTKDQKVIQEVTTAIANLAPHVAVLLIETDPPGATIYVDRKDLGSRGVTPRPLAVQPGQYRLLVERDGYELADSGEVVAKLGAVINVTLKLKRIVGTVQVSAAEANGAAVHVDDEDAPAACNAPCSFELPPGRHTLFFTNEGSQATPQQVTVAAGKTTRVKAMLSPLTGSVVVSADERDAVVQIDGRAVGFTPAVIPSVPVGRRRVRISLRGYTPVEREVVIKAGQQLQLLDVRLMPLRQVNAASRVTEDIEDAPSSVTIIDGQELRAFGYPTIGEALRGVRGISLSNDRTYISAGVRGLGEPNDYGNRLLILSDGQSLNDNLLNSSYIGSDGRADLHDVDRIEVVRGPGSLLYGTGALSGVVNLVTRPRDELTSVHAGVGTYDGAVARARGGFHYNLSPETGIWASVSGAQSRGVDLPITLKAPGDGPATVTALGVDRFKSWGNAGRLWSGPLTLQWFYHTREQKIPSGAYGTTLNTSSAFDDTRMMAELRYEPKLSEAVQVLVRAHANRYVFHGRYDFSPGDVNLEDYYGSWVGLEGRLVFSPSPRTRITLGGEGQLHLQASLHGESEDGSGVRKGYLDTDTPYEFGAVYGVIETSPAPWFRISAGARLDVYSTFGPIVVPRAALLFKPTAGGVLKVMGGRAFRAPSIYEQDYNDNAQTQTAGTDPSRDLSVGPEAVVTGEIEYSQRFLENWVALGAVHLSYLTGLINTVPDTVGSEIVRYQNGPAALTAGGDVELRREWRQGWMLGASYGYQQARFLDAPLGEDGSNSRFINAPQHLGSFRGVIPVVAEFASLGARIMIESPRRIDYTEDGSTPPVVLGDITLSGSVRRFGVQYTLGVYNVGGWKYSSPVTSNFLGRTMPQNGATALVDLLFTTP